MTRALRCCQTRGNRHGTLGSTRDGLRIFGPHEEAESRDRSVHGGLRLSERGDLLPAARRGRYALEAGADPGGIEGEGEGGRAVEPVPAGKRAWRRADQSRIRALVRDHGPHQLGARGVQLLGARHRQHGDDRALRHRRAEARVAGAAAGGRDPLGLRHDRAQGRVLRRHQHRDQHQARRRRLRHQRPEVVDLRHRRPALQAADRDGQDRPEGRGLPAAVDGPGAARRQGPEGAAHAQGDGLRRRAAWPRRGAVRECPRAGGEHPARRRAAASRSRKAASGRAASTTACASSASPSARSS